MVIEVGYVSSYHFAQFTTAKRTVSIHPQPQTAHTIVLCYNTPMKLRILSAQDVRKALPMPDAIDAMRTAFSELARGNAQTPQRLHLHIDDAGDTLFMPAYLPAGKVLTQKIVSIFPQNPQRGLPVITGMVMVLDAETGAPKALLEGSALTAIRTGAASGLATDLLAREDSSIAALIGAGGQGYDQARALLAVRKLKELRIISKQGESAARLAARLREAGVNARATSMRAGVQGADIISAATTSTTPLFLDADVAPGAHINLVGAYTPKMQEAPAATIMRAQVFVDDVMAAAHEAGDIIKLVRANLYHMNDLAGTLGQLLLGQVAGRESAEQVTVFKSVGLAVQDAAAAARALARAEELGLGQVLEW